MIQHLVGPVTGLLDKFIEDKDQKAKLAHEIATMAERHAHEASMGQIDGGLLWTAGRDHDVKAWDLNTFDAVHKLHTPHTRSVNALAVGGVDGTHLATAGDDRSVKVWPTGLDAPHH